MQEQTFKVTFKGKTVRGCEQSQAIANFAKLFKLPASKAEQMFDGKERTIKKSLSMEKAGQLRGVLKKAGIKVSLIKNESELPALGSGDWELNEPGTVILRPVTAPEVHIETSHMKVSLDESALENAEDKEPPEVDINHITIDDSEEPIIEESEVEVPEFNFEDVEVDEPGTVIVNAKKVEIPDIPVDALSLDDVGAQLVKKDKIEEPEIDISSISLNKD
ncbi:hypothetical protein [Marinicella rhabdoformis]|uniref:hypothetical protein n=1 Tax=Marinicella rhabdoformis TaxID=2580566 RepID=UPI0012AEC616|nr:hypothetical protein [Marinicella rhabdoformis]